ncbi:hypothetical protein A3Q56_07298, partial [Intoshia linei]
MSVIRECVLESHGIVDKSGIFTLGHYCPERTEVPISCIEGYYNDQVGSVKRSDCKPCPINEFSPIKGNDKCYSCGGKAFQTNIGQSTCICSENTKIFQPSDKSCVCKQDYNSIKSGSIIICSKRIFSICGWQEYRNEYGECWTLNQWKDHCKSKVCIQKKADFVKFDIHAGICICGNQKLDSICDLKCRIRRENGPLKKFSKRHVVSYTPYPLLQDSLFDILNLVSKQNNYYIQ